MEKDNNKLISKVQRQGKIVKTWNFNRNINCIDSNPNFSKVANMDAGYSKNAHNNFNLINIILVDDESDLIFTFEQSLGNDSEDEKKKIMNRF